LTCQEDCSLEIVLRTIKISTQHQQVAQRVKNHRQLGSAIVDFSRNRQRSFEGLLRAIPLTDENQVDAEIVVTLGGARLVISTLVIVNGFLEELDAVQRTPQEPTRARHVRVDAAEHVAGRTVANQVNRLIEILQRNLVVAFVNVRSRQSKIGFS